MMMIAYPAVSCIVLPFPRDSHLLLPLSCTFGFSFLPPLPSLRSPHDLRVSPTHLRYCYCYFSQCPLSVVEGWVVKAISSGLLDGKMDQPSQQVIVTRVAQRVFDAAEWKALQGTLHQWKGAVGQLLRSVEDAGR